MKNSINKIHKTFVFSLIVIASLCYSCSDFDKFELPEANSKADETPPSANFSYQQGAEDDFLVYTFSNLSSSSTTYAWDFGDGNTSSDKDAVNTYPDEGTYTVQLTSSDALNVTSTMTQTIEVIKPDDPAAIVPNILEASFEDEALPDGTGDGRDSWRISGRTIFGITSGGSNFHSGNQGAKFEVAPENRLGYQEVACTPNTDYKLIGYYKFKSSPEGGLVRFAVVAGSHSTGDDAEAAIFAQVEGGDLSTGDETNGYHRMELEFNSGANDLIGIWFDSNDMTEVRVDDVSIEVVE